MKIKPIILIIIATILICGCTSKNTYTNEHLSFEYPSDWKIENGNAYTPDGKLAFMFTITPSSIDLNTWMTQWTSECSAAGIPIESSGYTTIDGNPAAYVIDSDGMYEYYTIKNGMAYEFTFYGNNIPESEIQDIIRSIKLK